MGKAIGIHISVGKHEERLPKESVECKENHGIIGDYYAGKRDKNISFLAQEVINEVGLCCVMVPAAGSFKENITTFGVDLSEYPLGTHFKLGETIHEITQIGKTCNLYCNIYKEDKSCQVPFKTVFTKVLKNGMINLNDEIVIIPN